jgi:phosphate:Na+ symporter
MLSDFIWKLMAGVAIFLLGMKFLEESLGQVAGRSFKLFLKKQTTSKPKAILGGTIVTGILQSSSVVNLMVLAFVGANVIQMNNALGIILGANLGTTVSSWIVATVGFNMDVENIALPLVGIFGILMYLSNDSGKWHQWSKALFGIGFLFFGLTYIKTGMDETVKQVDLSGFNQYPAFVYMLGGFIFTAIIQSSSVTLAILLSALYAHAIDLYTGTAVVLGSEIGTSVKFLLASVKGPVTKKRVALGNFLFNVVTSSLVLAFLLPINLFITDIIHLKNNLLALVFFQSLINVICIVIFYPFLDPFGRFLEKRFITTDDVLVFIGKVNAEDTEPAIMALESEVKHFILCTLDFAREVFARPQDAILSAQLSANYRQKNLNDRYIYLKHLHGELHGYTIRMHNSTIRDTVNTLRLEQLMVANRNTMYACKSIKDAMPDVAQLHNSANDLKYRFYRQSAEKVDDFCKKITSILLHPKDDEIFERLSELYKSVTISYSLVLQQLYKENTHSVLNDIEISTLINFNREMYTAYKSYVFAAKDYLLDPRQAVYFDELPGFIR